MLTDSKFFLIITIGLIFIGGLVTVYRLATAEVATCDFSSSSKVLGLTQILALTNLCTAGIVNTATGFGDSLYSLDAYCFPSMQVVLVFMTLAVGSRAFCRLVMTNNMLDQLNLGLNLLPSSTFMLTDCEFSLIIITTGLLFLDGALPLDSLYLVQWENTELANVSVGLNQIFAIVVLTNLWSANIITAPEFKVALHGLSTCLFRAFRWFWYLQHLVVLIHFTFSPSMLYITADLLHLDLVWLLSIWRFCFTTCISSFFDLCRNKFNADFRVVAGWTEKDELGLRLFRVVIVDWDPIVPAMSPLFWG